MDEENLIIVDEFDNMIRMMSKLECHKTCNIKKGIIHRAFSILLFNNDKQLLVTQRSENKSTFPLYIGNSCCGHPIYNQNEIDQHDMNGIKHAAKRRICKELGISSSDIAIDDIIFMKRFVYESIYNQDLGEYELDYILVVKKDLCLNPSEDEVIWYDFIEKEKFLEFIGESHSDSKSRIENQRELRCN